MTKQTHFIRFLEALNTCDADLKPILGQLFDLHVSTVVEKNLAWFLISEVMETSQACKNNDQCVLVFPFSGQKCLIFHSE